MFLTASEVRNHAQTLRALRSWEGDAGKGVAEAVIRAYASLSQVTNTQLDLIWAVMLEMDDTFCVVPDIRSWV